MIPVIMSAKEWMEKRQEMDEILTNIKQQKKQNIKKNHHVIEVAVGLKTEPLPKVCLKPVNSFKLVHGFAVVAVLILCAFIAWKQVETEFREDRSRKLSKTLAVGRGEMCHVFKCMAGLDCVYSKEEMKSRCIKWKSKNDGDDCWRSGECAFGKSVCVANVCQRKDVQDIHPSLQ